MQGLFRNFTKIVQANRRLHDFPQFFYKNLTNELQLTETCIKKIEEKTSKTLNKFLRLTVEAGGTYDF